MDWKPDWERAKAQLVEWWAGRGLAACFMGPRAEPWEDIPAPAPPADAWTRWVDPQHRADLAVWQMSRAFFKGVAFPYFDTLMGPGSLGTMLGSEPSFDMATVWYEPCIDDPDRDAPLRFEAEGNRWYAAHLALIEEALARAEGRFTVGMPDLIENLDTLAALRGSMELLVDFVDRPAWVHARLAEITEAYREVFERFFARIVDADGGNAFAAFRLWGPGRTAKIQCDMACMLSPAMFREFFVPYAVEQCRHLDYVVFHLDGVNAMRHVDTLLGIEGIDAIQWTPGAGEPGAGDPCWYDLYRRIRAGGKGVQALNVQPEEILPLVDAVGPEGLFVSARMPDEEAADRMLEALGVE